MAEFFAMGGYAFYVWTSVGLTLAVLVLNAVLAARRHRRVLRSLDARRRQAEAQPAARFEELTE